jgi:hypothetical protein
MMSSRQRQRKKRARLSKIERAYRNKLARADAMQRAIERAIRRTLFVARNRPEDRPGLWARIARWFTK